MTARIIWIGKNSQMVVAPGFSAFPGATPAARPVVLPAVHGRAAPPSLPPRVPTPLPARGNLVCAHVYEAQTPVFDATNDRWIVPPPRVTREAGAAAEPRQPRHTRQSLDRPVAGPSAAGHLWHEVVEVFTVALGLTVFGLIAAFFLVMA